MEQHLGRKLDRTEHVHHINNDFTDNRIENLCVMSESEHHSFHNKKYELPREQRPSRIAWRKQYAERQRMKRLILKQLAEAGASAEAWLL